MIYTNSDKFWSIIILTNLSIFVFIFLESDGIITCTNTNNDPMELPYGDANLYTWDTMVFLLPTILAREGIKGITLKIKLFILCEITRNTINVIRKNVSRGKEHCF